jgi:hypothetical protein
VVVLVVVDDVVVVDVDVELVVNVVVVVVLVVVVVVVEVVEVVVVDTHACDARIPASSDVSKVVKFVENTWVALGWLAITSNSAIFTSAPTPTANTSATACMAVAADCSTAAVSCVYPSVTCKAQHMTTEIWNTHTLR